MVNPSQSNLELARRSAGQFTRRFHRVLITGSEVHDFLSNQSTFDTEKLPIGQFHLASFLDPQGRSEVYGWLMKESDRYTYLIPETLKDGGLARLNRFLISEDVTIEDPVSEDWTFIVGPKASSSSGFSGELFAEKAFLQREVHTDAPILSDDVIELWRGLTGWPSFEGTGFKSEIINNNRLFDLSTTMNKGCYPGQETVSKIFTRRGAAFSPVLLQTSAPLPLGPIFNFDQKIGEAVATYSWKNSFYTAANLLRDFRVEGMKLKLTEDATVRYYPLISGDPTTKSQELFFEAMEEFKNDSIEQAEQMLRAAVEVDPTNSDAWESLGVLLGRLERYDEAIECMRTLSEIDPRSVLAHTNMSLFLMKQGKIEEAEEQKSQATIKSFQSFGKEAQSREAEEQALKQKQAEWEQREGMFKQVLEIDPEDTLANYGLGSIAVEKKEFERARQHLEKVIMVDPKYSVAYLALGRAYLGLQAKEDAKACFEEGVRVAAGKGDMMPANQMQMELDQLSS